MAEEAEKLKLLVGHFKDLALAKEFLMQVTPQKLGTIKYSYTVAISQNTGLEFIPTEVKINPIIIGDAQRKYVKKLVTEKTTALSQIMLTIPKKLNNRTISSLYTRAETYGDLLFGMRKLLWKMQDDIREAGKEANLLPSLKVMQINTLRLLFNVCMEFMLKRGNIVTFEYDKGSVLLYRLADQNAVLTFANYSEIVYANDLAFDFPSQKLVEIEAHLRAREMVPLVNTVMKLVHWVFDFTYDYLNGKKHIL